MNDDGLKGVAVVLTSKTALIGLIGMLGLVAWIHGARMSDEATAVREQTAQTRQQAIETWELAAKGLLQSECKLVEDADTIFDRTESRITWVGKVPMRTEHLEKVRAQGWKCLNGVTYWTVEKKLPDGFVRDYKDRLAPAPPGAMQKYEGSMGVAAVLEGKGP